MVIFIIFFTFFYFSFKYFNFYGIYGVPGSIQINLIHLIKYYISLFRNNSNDKYTEINYNFNNNYT